MFKRSILHTVVFAAVVCFGAAAHAATCPSPIIAGDGVITLGGNAAGSSCLLFGSAPPNIGGAAG